MPSNKNTFINDEFSFDILQLLKKCWYFRKLIFFGTGILILLSLFTLIILNQNIKNKNYTSSVLRGDLGDGNSLIVDTLQSVDIVDEVLRVLSLDVNANKLLQHLIIKKGTDPLTMSLKSRINSLENSDIKKLALSNDDLDSIVKSLDDTSNDRITIEFYHSSLNLNDKQAINIINKLVNDVNKNIKKHTTKANNKLFKINTDISGTQKNNAELIIILSHILRSIKLNLGEMENHTSKLIDTDLKKMKTLADMYTQILHESSKLIGNTYSSSVLNVELLTAERNIKDLKNSLQEIDIGTALPTDNNISIPGKKAEDNITLDGDLLTRLLSMGGALQLNEFRLETLTRIQDLQVEKNLLLSQKEILKLPLGYNSEDLAIESIAERILTLTEKVNRAISQVSKFTQPKKAVHFLKNPETTNDDKIMTSSFINIALILSLISFFFISFIAILLPQKNSKH